MGRDKKTLIRRFHEARWDEEMIMEQSVPGERGVLLPKADPAVKRRVGDGADLIPEALRRNDLPNLPEVNQMRVNRHFMRLSQETMGCDVAADISQGTCTMKYSPKVQEHLVARNPGLAEVHPCQSPETLQGLLKIYHEFEKMLASISGLDAFCFQPGGGGAAVFANACIVRAYHRDRGEEDRTEIVTTIYAHPTNAASSHTAGYDIVTLMPNEDGLPDFEAFKQALSRRTAAFFITNPEDTGIYNPRIKEFVDAAHAVGALCVYDQANANSIMGITRAKEAGFDLCHFNLHKTFSSPHGGMGPACGALGVRADLRTYLPLPRVTFDGQRYGLETEDANSIGMVRSFLGNAPLIVRSYMWLMQIGADGVREVAITAVLNNQYMFERLRKMRGITIHYGEDTPRLCQVRYSWEQLKEETGFDTWDFYRRMIDYGLQHYFPAHHPWLFSEPWTIEPCESYNLDDIEEHLAVFERILKECYEQPELIRNAPVNAPVHRFDPSAITEHEKMFLSWRQYQRKTGKGKERRVWEEGIDWGSAR